MRKNLLKVNLVALSILLGSNAFAQEKPLGVCGTDRIMNEMFSNNPELKKVYDAKQAEFLKNRKLGKFQHKSNQIIEIPIVVHILDDGKQKYVPTEAEVNSWIARANSIFDGSASDIKGPDEGGTTLPVRLVLAKRTPDNKSTNGIITHNLSGDIAYVENGVDGNGIDHLVLNNSYNWDTNSYYNIYVTNMIEGVNRSNSKGSLTLGFAYPPGGYGDLSVMLYDVVIDKDDTTFAHEMLHAFGVLHPFEGGDGDGKECGTEENDNIEDTQRVRSGLWFGSSNNTYNDYQVMPIIGTTLNDCINEPFDHTLLNIMNYGHNLDRFTPGQGQMAIDVIYAQRSGLLTSLALTTPSTTSNIPVNACVPEKITNIGNFGRGMTLVNLGTINNVTNTPTRSNPNFYHDYSKFIDINSAYSTEVTEGETVTITLGNQTPNLVKYAVYIDYNNNGKFEASEKVISDLEINSTDWDVETVKTSNIIIPTNSVKNKPLRMRVIGDSPNADFDACADRITGEVEDYTLIVKEATSTVWDGTKWSAGEPTETKEAIIKGDLVVTDRIDAKKFILESGSVKIQNNGIIISPEIVNNLTADKFIINSNVGLIQWGNDTTVSGEFTVIQNSSPMILNDATLWSSPVKGQNLRSFSPKTLLKRFYKYDEAANSFSSLFVNDPLYPNSDIKDPNTYKFETGIGYHIRVSADQSTTVPSLYEGIFVGELNTGRIEIPATVNSFGYNLVGNPYPSSINGVRFLQQNTDVETLYFWTQQSPLTANGYASNNYATYTRAGGVNAAAGNETPNGNISKGQGFFVEMIKPGNVVFDNSMRGNLAGAVVMHKNGDDNNSKNETKRIRLDLFEGTQAKNQILIAYMDEATNGFDHQIDGKLNKIYTGSSLYSLIDNNDNKFVIQGRDTNTFVNDVVKLGFEAKTSGAYTIKLSDLENISNQSVYIKDKKDNQLVDLTKSDYQFNSEVGTFEDRFELVYSTETLGTSETDNLSNGVNVVKTSSGLKVVSTKELSTIEVFDISGRKVFAKEVNGTEVLISGLIKSNQLLVVKVTTKEGKMVNNKVIY